MKKIQGFTLIELLVTLFIIITLAAVIIPKFYNYDKETKLDIVAQEVKEAILETQSLALAPPTTSSNIEYYKIIINTNSYQIDEHKTDNADHPNSQAVILPDGVTFSGFTNNSYVDIDFYVENRGRAQFNPLIASGQATLQLSDESSTKTITIIQETGQVTID
jgi:prepilin-type N-terminal cleavage/methylation domain-containing protein